MIYDVIELPNIYDSSFKLKQFIREWQLERLFNWSGWLTLFDLLETIDNIYQALVGWGILRKDVRNDFDRLTGKKRIWLKFNTRLLTDIGDGIDEPAWYYKDRSCPFYQLSGAFSELGKPIENRQLLT